MIAGQTIIVVGAGIGGLTFGNALLQLCAERNIAKPDIRIYERDVVTIESRSLVSRNQIFLI
jgi:2-polyprenyl-6-methoxyphenol hydroxylase-like FAD-dependent oxidoreductase